MSEEKRAVIEAEIEELETMIQDVTEEWVDGYISYGDCVAIIAQYQDDKSDLIKLLRQ